MAKLHISALLGIMIVVLQICILVQRVQHVPNLQKATKHTQIQTSESGMNTVQNHGQRKFDYVGPVCNQSYTEAQLADVFEAHRLEWASMGKKHPWFSVIISQKWKGMADIPIGDKDEFYGSGEKSMPWIQKAFQEQKIPLSCNRALDFGSGLGRLSAGLAKVLGCKKVVGVDQSFYHIRTARKEMRRLGLDKTVEFRLTNVDLLKTLAGDKFDFFLSLIVLQHMVPPLQVAYIEQICDAMLVGGHGLFQIPTNLPRSPFDCNFEKFIDTGGMQMHFLEAVQVRAVLGRRGCPVLHQWECGMIGSKNGAKAECFIFSKTQVVPV